MRLALAIAMVVGAAAPAPTADLSAADVRALLSMAGVNPGTSREIGGERKTITSVHVLRGLRRGDYVIRVHIDGGRKADE